MTVKFRYVMVLVFVLALMTVPLCAQSTEIYRQWNQPVKPFKIIGNVYYVGVHGVTAYLVTTPKGHILIDACFTESVSYITKSIETLGFDVNDVKILLNSHAHIDHAGGLAGMRERTGAKMICMVQEVPLLESGDKDDYLFGNAECFPPCPVDQVIQDGEKVRWGGAVLTAHLTAGHTRGGTTWSLAVNENDTTYNVVFLNSLYLIPQYDGKDNPFYPEMVTDYQNTYKILKVLPCDVFLSTHTGTFQCWDKYERFLQNPPANPFVDPEGYRNYVHNMERQCSRVLKSRGITY